RRGIEISLTEGWASAAASIFYQCNFEPERFEYFHCGDADVRFVVAHKGVIPENHMPSAVAGVADSGSSERGKLSRLTGITDPGYRMSFKPRVEALLCVMRQ